MYDKFGRVLRLETTTNDVSFFKHHRKVEHQDGHSTRELAPLKKTIYSLIDLREILAGLQPPLPGVSLRPGGHLRRRARSGAAQPAPARR